MLAEGRDAEALEALDEEIGMVESPEDIALEMLRKHQEEQGMQFDDPDAPVGGFRKEGDQLVPYQAPDEDEEIPGEVMGRDG